MRVRSVRSVSAVTADAVLCGVFEGGREAPGTGTALRRLGWPGDTLGALRFSGDRGSTLVLPRPGRDGPLRLVLVGLGDEVDLEALRQAAAEGRRAAGSARKLATTLHQLPMEGATRAVCEGLALADYSFEGYRSQAEAREELEVELLSPPTGWRADAETASVVSDAVGLARDLVNQPSADKPPLGLAERVAALASQAGLDPTIWSGGVLEAERMAGILAVGSGSERPPCLLRLERRTGARVPRLAMVGKGIVFDSGGLSIKTAEGMQTMKTDMAGMAAVVAAAIAIARLDLPVDLDVLAPLAENMPGGGAQRPGDVLRIRNGKTIEVLNTDAEGRLVLADALVLASEAEPDLVVDVATLTGACKVALGEAIAGVWGNREEAVERVAAAAESAGERVWPMPLPSDYRSLIDSDVADMKNTGGRFGGAITAALLLAEFVGEVPWAHLDVAGPARSEAVKHYIPKGGTGFGVRTLVELAAGMGEEGAPQGRR